jgi:hypothetical protein
MASLVTASLRGVRGHGVQAGEPSSGNSRLVVRRGLPSERFNGFSIVFRHLQKALTLKIEGSDGRVLSARTFEPAEFSQFPVQVPSPQTGRGAISDNGLDIGGAIVPSCRKFPHYHM